MKASGLKVVWFDPEEKGNDREECLSQLEWELPFWLDYQDEMTTYRPQKTLHVERGFIKGDVTVEKVEVGPLSMLIPAMNTSFAGWTSLPGAPPPSARCCWR